MTTDAMIGLAALGGFLWLLLAVYGLVGLVARILGYGDAWAALDGPPALATPVYRGNSPKMGRSVPAAGREPAPPRMPGCITCEGAESAGAAALRRHLARDHGKAERPGAS